MGRVARTLVGVLATLTLSLGLLLQSVVQFVSSADATADTVESVLTDAAVRDLISEKIIEKVEDENSDPTQRLLFVVARERITQLVAEKIKEPVAAGVVSGIVRGAYRVYVDGENIVAIDLTRFSQLATDAIEQIDARLSTDFLNSFQSFEIERPRDSQKLGPFLTMAQIATWVLLFIGIALLIVLWRSGDNSRHHRARRLSIVVGATGLVLGVLVLLTRAIAPRFSKEHREVVSVLTDFITNPVWTKAVACALLAAVVGGVSMQLSRR